MDIFPESVPENASDTLKRVTIRNLLTMNSGHGTDPTGSIRRGDGDWVRGFMEWPLEYEPGTCYCYNSLGTYVLSAAVQKVTGQKIVDYLDTRLWQPLGIDKPRWLESPAGINTGGWGLYLHTQDLAKMGLCLLRLEFMENEIRNSEGILIINSAPIVEPVTEDVPGRMKEHYP